MTFELRRKIQVSEAWMAAEHEAVHLPRFALVPVGARIDGDPRLDAQVVVRKVGLQDHAPALTARRLDEPEHLVSPVAARGAVGLFLRLRGSGSVARPVLDDRRR